VGKLSGLREGEPFVENGYWAAIRRLEAGDYLRNDSIPEITPNENYDGVELLFQLTELPANRLELGGGYLPGQGDTEGKFVGQVRYESKNLFGYGRHVELFFSRKDKSSTLIEFLFGQPFFIPDHLELQMHLSQVDYDSSYYLFTIDGGVSLLTRRNTRIGAGISWTKTEPQRSSQPPSRALSGLVEYEVQRFDYASNPSSGTHLIIGLSYIRRTSWPDTVASTVVEDESTFEIAADNYFHPGKGIVLRLNVESKVRVTSRDLIDFSEQFKLGGYGSLRGYRQDQFAGRRTFLGQAEIRLRPSEGSAFYLFSDLGYVYSKKEMQPGIIESEKLTRFGSGLGFYIGSPSARMTLEIGWGRHDSFDQGKVHFGLVTLF
jgi:outer membrane protein insertion porin family